MDPLKAAIDRTMVAHMSCVESGNSFFLAQTLISFISPCILVLEQTFIFIYISKPSLKIPLYYVC